MGERLPLGVRPGGSLSQPEYIHQRPNMEFWIRHALDRGIKMILPARCPLLKSGPQPSRYAFDPKPDLPLREAEFTIARIKQAGALLQQQIRQLKWYQGSTKADLLARLAVVELELADARASHQRLSTMYHAA